MSHVKIYILNVFVLTMITSTFGCCIYKFTNWFLVASLFSVAFTFIMYQGYLIGYSKGFDEASKKLEDFKTKIELI